MAMGNFSGIVLEEAAEITEDQWRALTLDVIVNRHRRALREHAESIRAKQEMRWRFHQRWLDCGRYEGDSLEFFVRRMVYREWWEGVYGTSVVL